MVPGPRRVCVKMETGGVVLFCAVLCMCAGQRVESDRTVPVFRQRLPLRGPNVCGILKDRCCPGWHMDVWGFCSRETADQQTAQPDLTTLRKTRQDRHLHLHRHRHRLGNRMLRHRSRQRADFSPSVTPRIRNVTKSFTTPESPVDVKVQSTRRVRDSTASLASPRSQSQPSLDVRTSAKTATGLSEQLHNETSPARNSRQPQSLPRRRPDPRFYRLMSRRVSGMTSKNPKDGTLSTADRLMSRSVSGMTSKNPKDGTLSTADRLVSRPASSMKSKNPKDGTLSTADRLVSRPVSSMKSENPKDGTLSTTNQNPPRQKIADDLARRRRFHYLATLRRSCQLATRRRLFRQRHNPDRLQSLLRNHENSQSKVEAPRRRESLEKHFSEGEGRSEAGQKRDSALFQQSNPPLKPRDGHQNSDAGKIHTDTETKQSVPPSRSLIGDHSGEIHTEQSVPPFKSLTGHRNAKGGRRPSNSKPRPPEPPLKSRTQHRNTEAGQEEIDSDAQRPNPPVKSRARHPHREPRQRSSEPAAVPENPQRQVNHGRWMSYRHRPTSPGQRRRQTTRWQRNRRPVVAFRSESKRDDSNIGFSEHHTARYSAKTPAERYEETQTEGKGEELKMQQRRRSGGSLRPHRTSTLKSSSSVSDVAPQRKDTRMKKNKTDSHDDLHVGSQSTRKDDLKANSKTDLSGSVEEKYRSLRKENFQSDSPREDTDPNSRDRDKANAQQVKRTDRDQHEQKPQMKSAAGTKGLPGPSAQHTSPTSSKSGNFKTKLNRNLRSHLKDPRMHSLFRTLGAKRMGRKPFSSHSAPNPAKQSQSSLTSREGSPRQPAKDTDPRFLREDKNPSSKLEEEAEREALGVSGNSRSVHHSHASYHGSATTSREPPSLPTLPADKLPIAHQQMPRPHHSPPRHAPLSGSPASDDPVPDLRQPSPRQRAFPETLHRAARLSEAQESSSLSASAAEEFPSVENARSSLLSGFVKTPSRSAASSHKKLLIPTPQRASSGRNPPTGLPAAGNPSTQQGPSRGSGGKPSSELRQTQGIDAPSESDEEQALNDDGRFPIAAIAVEDVNTPGNDAADFRLSRRKRPSRLRPSEESDLAAEGRRDPAPRGDGDQGQAESGGHAEDPRQTSQRQKEKARALFPNHRIIDLDIRYQRRPVPKPVAEAATPTPETMSSPERDPEAALSEPGSKDALSVPRPTKQTGKPISGKGLNHVGPDAATAAAYRPLLPVGRTPRLRHRTQPVGLKPEGLRSLHGDSRSHEKTPEGIVEEVHTPGSVPGVLDRGTIKPVKARVENDVVDTGDEAGTSPAYAVTSEALDGVTDRSCRDDLCRNASRVDAESVTAVDREGLNPLAVECPPGHRRALRNQYIVCEPLRARFANMTADQLCTEGQILVPLPGGRAVCVEEGAGPVTCPEGHVMVTEVGGASRCQEASTITPCPAGQVPVVGDAGYHCQHPAGPQPTPTPPPTPPPLKCPEGQRELTSEGGSLCLPDFFVTTLSPSLSGNLCPSGMTPVETSVGVYCLHAGEFFASSTTPSTTPSTTSSTTPKTTSTTAEKPTAGPDALEPETKCPEDMIVIETPAGDVCGFEAGPRRGPKCPEGQVLAALGGRYQCRSRELGPEAEAAPCPSGQSLVETGEGIVCKHRRLRLDVDVLGNHGCSDRQILTQTPSGFFCQDSGDRTNTGRGPALTDSRPACPPSTLAVRLTSGELTCLPRSEATLKCSQDMELKRTRRGYFCQRRETGLQSATKCREGEVLLVDEGRAFCQRLEKNGDLCGAGYKPQMTQHGLVCQQEFVPLNCPPSFHLSNQNGNFSCVPAEPTANICKDPAFKTAFGDRVVCADGNLSGVLVPCGEGYHVTVSDVGPLCELEKYATVLCRDGGNGSVPSCIVQKTPACKNCGKGKKKSCKEIRQEAFQGCRPRCANGGRCLEGRCHCPAGVTGTACQQDIDECRKLPVDFCQHGCHNLFGSFRCTCPQNATLNSDGRTCQYTECLPSCLNGAHCHRGLCVCPAGFTGHYCQQDVDECKTGAAVCEHRCLNTVGSYTCICPPGSRLASDQHTCVNTTCVPECRNGGLCDEKQKCRCQPGYTGFVCQLDINECRARHSCSHYCFNTYGSYRCACPRGFILRHDGKTCAKTFRISG